MFITYKGSVMSPVALSTQKRRYTYSMVFVLFFVTFSFFFQGGGWNQNSRMCLVRSIVQHKTFTINACKEDLQEIEFANTGDWSFYNGQYYSNKSPGLSFMAVLPYAMAQYCVQYVLPDNHERQVLLSAYVSTVCTTVLFSAILCLLIFYLCCTFFRMSTTESLFATIFYGCGTIAFSYSTTFYCHQPAAFCSFFAFLLLLHIRKNSAKKNSYALLAGFFAGTAVLIEPSAIITLIALLCYVTCCIRNRYYLCLFILGCLPPGILQGMYNVVCFNHPLASSYSYANDVVMWKNGGSLFGIPSPMRFFRLFFSPHHGLFISSPIFLMALPGIFFSLKDRKWRVEAIFCAGVSLSFIGLIASFHAWHGGSAIGPRYLLPAFPFAFVFIIFALKKYPKLVMLLGIFSLIINVAITLIGNEIPRHVTNPLGDVILKQVLNGHVSINPFPLSNLEKYEAEYPSLHDFAQVEKWKPNFNSFNLGEILFPNNLLSMLPLICFWAVWFSLWRSVLMVPFTGS